MNEFKFFARHIAIAHDGGYIFAGEYFYTMNKEEFQLVTGEMAPKYHIIPRWVHPTNKDSFKPCYDKFWYFNSESNAVYLRSMWIREDNQITI